MVMTAMMVTTMMMAATMMAAAVTDEVVVMAAMRAMRLSAMRIVMAVAVGMRETAMAVVVVVIEEVVVAIDGLVQNRAGSHGPEKRAAPIARPALVFLHVARIALADRRDLSALMAEAIGFRIRTDILSEKGRGKDRPEEHRQTDPHHVLLLFQRAQAHGVTIGQAGLFAEGVVGEREGEKVGWEANIKNVDSLLSWYIGIFMRRKIERIQTGVRIEKRLLKVLKGTAEHLDMSVGDLIEGIALHSFENKPPFSEETRKKIAQLKAVYDLDLSADDSHKFKEDEA